MNTPPTTRGLTPSQVHTALAISHHENLWLLIVFLIITAVISTISAWRYSLLYQKAHHQLMHCRIQRNAIQKELTEAYKIINRLGV